MFAAMRRASLRVSNGLRLRTACFLAKFFNSLCYCGVMAIAPLSSKARDYIRAYDLTSICQWRDGRLGVSRCPTGAEAAWWCSSKDAGAVVRSANANGRDVVAAAARLHTSLTDHATVAQRVDEAVDRIDDGLKAAQRRGDLAFFNQLYKAQRVAAQAQGRRFMPYGVALRRLRIAVAQAAANGGQCTRSLMLSVFADGEP
jgi:hypothetical protein